MDVVSRALARRAASAALSDPTPNDSGVALHHRPSSSQPPETQEAQREVVVKTLSRMLHDWIECQRGAATIKPAYFATSPNADMGADICEALGRLGI